MSRVQARGFAVLLTAVVVAALPGAAAAAGHAASAAAGVPGSGTTAVPGPGTAAAVPGAGSPAAGEPAPPETQLVEADQVTFRITVYENRSVRYEFIYTRTLANDSEREQFREFAAEFNDNETATFRNFKQTARGMAALGRNETGRDMTARHFRKHARVGGRCAVPDDCGTVRMSFLWTAFAYEDGGRLVVDDVFEGGLYLGADRELVFRAGPGLQFAAVLPDPASTSSPGSLADSETVTFVGERDFPDRRPRVEFRPADAAGGTSTATASPSTNGDATAPPAADGTPTATPVADTGGSGGMSMLLLGGLFLVLLGGGVAFVRRRDTGDSGGQPVATAGPSGGDGGAAAAEGGSVADEPAVPDEELLTDEDQVLNLLRSNGGRMKQVDIVDETGWSKSKVSMLLSDMAEADQISKLRVGRENIISLAGHEPEAAGSPHDDDDGE